MSAKAKLGHYFEDFSVGQVLNHATPRTITTGDVALYTGLYGPRFAVQSSDAFARAAGYRGAPVDDLLVFHTVFGKTVPDISLNAVANLGYAECRFLTAVYPGDTLSARSEVIGVRENANRAWRRLRAHDGPQPERRGSAGVRALGDGAQARQGLAGPRAARSKAWRAGRTGRLGPRGARDRHPTLRSSSWPALRTAGATTQLGRRSTISMR